MGVAILAISGAAQAQSPAPAQINFSIPAGSLAAALNAYASQAGRQLMFTSDQVAGRRSPGLSGRMSADAALDQLLAGSGLVAVQSSSGAWVLQRGSRDEVAEAVVVDDIVVTGTLLRGPGDTPSPVTVIRRDDLDRTGRATIADALAALPQNYAGSGTPTAALVGSDPMQSNSGLATGVNLRGLGPDSTLVLVNGRRMAGAGGRGDFADVSAVPTAAVERVDVLLDGASALYGADAVGGVVNIILRRDFDGQESRLRVGASKGGGESVIAAHTIGRTWSTGQALLSYEFERQNALSTMDRPYTATGDLRPFGGTDHRTYYGVPGNIVRFDNASSSYVVTHAIRPGTGGVAVSAADFAAGQQNYDNTRAGAALIPEFDRHAAYLYARQQVGAHLELTGDLRFSQREFETESITPTAIATVTTANPHFVSPTGATSHSIAYSFGEDLGTLRRSGRARSLGATLGARVFLPADWEAEAFLTYGSERTFDGSRGMIHSSNLQEALGNTADNPATAFSAPRDGYLNLFGSGAANSRTVLDFISNGWNRYTDESEVASVNLIAQGTAFKLPAGDLKVAVGAQFRTEGLKNSGVTFTSGLAPLFTRSPDKDRKATATFLEVRAPLIGPDQAIPGVQKLELSLAGRWEDYDDIGSTANPKIGLMWTPVEDLKIRANWGTSFRAPAMTELAQRRYISATFVADTVGQQVALFEGGGNPDLKPETADTFTFGFDYRPKDRSWRFDTVSGAMIGARMKMSSRITAAGEQRTVVATRDDRNREALALDGAPPMIRLNDRLADISFASAEAVTHQSPDGSPLVSWLYRPLKTGDRKPTLIVIPYPGEPAYRPASPGDGLTSNVQLMTAAGYAVLIPSLPRPDRRGEPAIGMADDILRAVDAAAPLGAFDPDRVVLWGHSFGAFAAVAAATQSDRLPTPPGCPVPQAFTRSSASAPRTSPIGMRSGRRRRAERTRSVRVPSSQADQVEGQDAGFSFCAPPVPLGLGSDARSTTSSPVAASSSNASSRVNDRPDASRRPRFSTKRS